MKYGQKTRQKKYREVWQEYCGFLDLTTEEYMGIQYRLLGEQIPIWASSGLGQSFLRGKMPETAAEFREMVPLTSYQDYADILLGKQSHMLPGEPVIWLSTTWEGGKHPEKVAPYTRAMLDVFRENLLAATTLSSCDEHKQAKLTDGDRVLFGLAPLPYVTGLFPLVFQEEIRFKFLPPVEEAHTMSFGERNRKGFSMGVNQGIELFFGMTSVTYYITANFGAMMKQGSGGKKLSKLLHMSPRMLYRLLHAMYTCKKEEREVMPKDIFRLKALVCAGTDTASYKEALHEAWGIEPMEAFAGTEVAMVGTETTTRRGMVFFPNSNFYEFIPEDEVYRSMDDPAYVPSTVLMDQLVADHNYELVVTNLKGGAFARYRVGDMFRCISTGGDKSTRLPLLVPVDRVPSVIDIAGFTRITENSISDVVELSGLPIGHWIAKKEYDNKRRPYLHLYLELKAESLDSVAISKQVIKEHLQVYFNYFDTDYEDLKKMLGIDPLVITILKCGTVEAFEKKTGKKLRRVNPKTYELAELLQYDPWMDGNDGRLKHDE